MMSLLPAVESDSHSFKKSALLLVLSFLLLFPGKVGAQSGEDFIKGEIVDRVTCKKNPRQTYALYLPSDYSPEKKWPILYAFDPGARGKEPLLHFRKGAEEYHYIVVGSNNSRNGPRAPEVQAILAVWEDTHSRFSLDERRIYVTGFSGAARVASFFPKTVGSRVEGIIACGAGLAADVKPKEINPAVYYGIIGMSDFNYREMTALDQALDQEDVRHWVQIFEGGHEWPEAFLCTQAIEWMEIRAMNQGIIPVDRELLQAVFSQWLGEARVLEEAGKIPQAISSYERTLLLFKEMTETAEVEQKIDQLTKTKAFKYYTREEAQRRRKEQNIITDFAGWFAWVDHTVVLRRDLPRLFEKMGIERLLAEEKKEKNIFDAAPSRRLLLSLTVNARDKGIACLRQEKTEKAVVYFEIASKASEQDSLRHKDMLYNLACACALNDEPRQAIKNLRLAVENGFRERELIESDHDLDSIRETEEFREILKILERG